VRNENEDRRYCLVKYADLTCENSKEDIDEKIINVI